MKEKKKCHTIIVYLLFNSLISHIYSPKPNEEDYVLSCKSKILQETVQLFSLQQKMSGIIGHYS